MCAKEDGELLLAETAASTGTTSERAQALLEVLRRVVPFDGAWLALADPLGHGYHSLASIDLDVATVDFLSGPVNARDIEVTGADGPRPPLSPSDLPYPAEELPTWAECLMPAGIHEALALALFAPSGRHVGFLALLSGSRQPPSPATRRRLGRLAPVLAHGIDPMRSLLTAARLAAARQRIREGQVYSSFLWPVGGPHAPDGHVRVTVLAAPEDVPPGLTALALLSPATDLHGLTPREMEVLGLLVEGCSNQEIARTLVVAPRTVATHLEHVLGKLGASTRTLAAVRAERDGLYVPRPARAGREEGGQRPSAGSASSRQPLGVGR